MLLRRVLVLIFLRGFGWVALRVSIDWIALTAATGQLLFLGIFGDIAFLYFSDSLIHKPIYVFMNSPCLGNSVKSTPVSFAPNPKPLVRTAHSPMQTIALSTAYDCDGSPTRESFPTRSSTSSAA